MWAVVETYYKHGEYELKIFNTKDLKKYLVETLMEYSQYHDDVCFDIDDNDIDNLIRIVVEIGNVIVESQEGWGVREIREIRTND